MPARIHHITFDCRDPEQLGAFWAELLGFGDDPDNANAPGDPEWLIVNPAGIQPGLLFVPVPEDKVVENRVHLDLQPADGRDVEVERVDSIGGDGRGRPSPPRRVGLGGRRRPRGQRALR